MITMIMLQIIITKKISCRINNITLRTLLLGKLGGRFVIVEPGYNISVLSVPL